MSEFCGHPTATLDNGFLRLEYLTDVGPRIARLFPAKSDVSLLAELPEASRATSYGSFQLMGGHRLWHSPETLPRTYIPDQPVTVETLPDGIRLSASTEPGSGVAKTIEIHLTPKQPAVTIRHELRNDNLWTIELAPWALTMFRLAGTAIFPQAVGNADPHGLLSNRHLELWPYTDVRDARLHLDNDFILFKANAALPPSKIGYYNPHGWMAYWLDGILFVKRYQPQPHAAFPDNGCNTETYCNDQFIELETLGPLVKLAPGERVVHEETWELHDGLNQSFIPDSLRKRLV
jgi:hypothetical protein